MSLLQHWKETITVLERRNQKEREREREREINQQKIVTLSKNLGIAAFVLYTNCNNPAKKIIILLQYKNKTYKICSIPLPTQYSITCMIFKLKDSTFNYLSAIKYYIFEDINSQKEEENEPSNTWL